MAINLMSLLMIIIISFLMVAHNVNSTTFSFPRFGLPNANSIAFEGDAFASNGVLKLTKTDAYGSPLPNSAGRASFAEPVHLWDSKTGEIAAFNTTFFFDVEPTNSGLHGDGITFFIAPFDSVIPKNSTGGFLGLVGEDSAFNAYKNQIVAVEFDTYANTWDPVSPHIGIDVNSIVSKSISTVPWGTGKSLSAYVTVSYVPALKILGVLVRQVNSTTSLSFEVDLRTVLPEWVRVGFSGATGQLVESHRIYFWSFSSSFTY